MSEEEYVQQCNKWLIKITNKFGTTTSQQFKTVLLDMFESTEELLNDLHETDWEESALMDTLHREQSAFDSMDYCNTFYKRFKDIVYNKSAHKSRQTIVVLPPELETAALNHHSRHTLDKWLLYGYCRSEQEAYGLSNILTDENIIYTLLLYYHIPIILETIDFDISDADINNCKEIFKLQCPTLTYDSGQKPLWSALAVSAKNRLPLLSLCVDSFGRDRLNYFNETQRLLTVNEWANDYKILKKIAPNSKRDQHMFKSAVNLWNARYRPTLQLPVYQRYDDDLEMFTLFIIETTSFIETLTNETLLPLQIELIIIPKNIVDLQQQSNGSNVLSDDDDQFSEDDSTDDDTEIDDSTNKSANCMPNIEKRLMETGTKYKSVTLEGASGLKVSRTFYAMFQDLKFKILKLKIDKFGMPHRQRLCIVVDRRGNETVLYMYRPTPFLFPRDCLNEWHFESACQCIIPATEARDIISARDSKNGSVFCLSFHCQQKDAIKCYLYTRSAMIRFLPEDICQLLPLLFVETKKNKKFVKQERSMHTTKYVCRIKLSDRLFDHFREFFERKGTTHSRNASIVSQDLKEWMTRSALYEESLYNVLKGSHIYRASAVFAMTQTKFDEIVRKYRIDQVSKSKDEKSKHRIDEILIKFEKAYQKGKRRRAKMNED